MASSPAALLKFDASRVGCSTRKEISPGELYAKTYMGSRLIKLRTSRSGLEDDLSVRKTPRSSLCCTQGNQNQARSVNCMLHSYVSFRPFVLPSSLEQQAAGYAESSSVAIIFQDGHVQF